MLRADRHVLHLWFLIATAKVRVGLAGPQAPKDERDQCPYWQEIGCLLDVMEKLCLGAPDQSLIDPALSESAWMCCCPEPYKACGPQDFFSTCRLALAEQLGPLVVFPTDTTLLEALQRVRGTLRDNGGDACSVLGEEEPISDCRAPPYDGLHVMERSDLACETLAWQWEKLGDGDPAEFAKNGCPFVAGDRAADGESRKGATLTAGNGSLLIMSGYVAVSGDLVRETYVSDEIRKYATALTAADWDLALHIYENGSSQEVQQGTVGEGSLNMLLQHLGETELGKLFDGYYGPNYVAEMGLVHQKHLPLEGMSDAATAIIATKAVELQGVTMLALHSLELAAELCRHGVDLHAADASSATAMRNAGARRWDKAWAYVVGRDADSEAGAAESSLFKLAETLADKFGTLNENSEPGALFKPKAAVNWELLRYFWDGSLAILRYDDVGNFTGCAFLEENKEKIRHSLYVPLLQNALLHSYSSDPAAQTVLAERWAAAAAILPLAKQCDTAATQKIRDLMSPTATEEVSAHRRYREVKDLLENMFECMGVNCADVGALLVGGAYVAGLLPCGQGQKDQTQSGEHGLLSNIDYDDAVIDSTILAVILLVVCLCCSVACGCLVRWWTSRNKPKADTKGLVQSQHTPATLGAVCDQLEAHLPPQEEDSEGRQGVPGNAL
eukprot:TRINITY_DN50754_c0_g1_i1.p1 TRINITY_DN50754_c0_g1~~TRINITY_DN50754_c0_g1_i1.p1  ORF type:complete len:672 (+),score=133.46 TRINITY_DN50754_c0_g1_i1:91-2106(+)